MRDFRQKKAPFILVSGGNVHPNLTPYNEALEMKMALMREFGVPENAILVDPTCAPDHHQPAQTLSA